MGESRKERTLTINVRRTPLLAVYVRQGLLGCVCAVRRAACPLVQVARQVVFICEPRT